MNNLNSLKLTAIAAALAISALNASAQAGAPVTHSQKVAQNETQQIQEKVTGLTQDQLSKILAVEQEWAKARDDAKNSGVDAATLNAKKKILREDRNAKIKNIMTTDQYKHYQAMERWQHIGYHSH